MDFIASLQNGWLINPPKKYLRKIPLRLNSEGYFSLFLNPTFLIIPNFAA
jgi:hypothetical protein